jgi:hypothetical protein
MKIRSKLCLGVILLLLIVATGIFIWKLISENQMIRNMESQRITLIERSQEFLDRKTTDMLELMAVPFVWAVRREMIRNNYDQINEYLTQFVKNPSIKSVVVVVEDAIIAVATDKKQEGRSFSSYYPHEYLTAEEIEIVVDDDRYIQVIAPIMGLNRRIGTLLITFIYEKINL